MLCKFTHIYAHYQLLQKKFANKCVHKQVARLASSAYVAVIDKQEKWGMLHY